MISYCYKYLHEARGLIRSLNKQFYKYHTITLTYVPGAVEFYFKRKQSELNPERHLLSEKHFLHIIDREIEISGSRKLYEFCKIGMKFKVNP